MIVDGKYYDGVTPQSALEIVHGLSSSEESTEKEAEA
jgi:hypothetical protein